MSQTPEAVADGRAAISRSRLPSDGRANGVHPGRQIGERPADDADLDRLAAVWRAGRGPASDVADLVGHPAYRKIVAAGGRAVPFLLRELRRRPDHWFAALRELTGENPVAEADAGRVRRMAAAWVAWGVERGHIGDDDVVE